MLRAVGARLLARLGWRPSATGPGSRLSAWLYGFSLSGCAAYVGFQLLDEDREHCAEASDLREHRFVRAFDEAAAAKCQQLVFGFASSRQRLARVLQELWIAVEATSLGEVFVSRVRRRNELVESGRSLTLRQTGREFVDLIRKFSGRDPNSKFLVVTHGAIMRAQVGSTPTLFTRAAPLHRR